MLALFLNHPPMFVTGEIALCLSLALFVGALIAAIVRRASEISQLREAGHPNTTIVRQSLAEPIYARPNVPRPATATTPVVRSRPRSALRQTRHLVLRRLGPDARAVSPWKFPTKPSTARGRGPPPDQNAAQINGTAAESPRRPFALMRK
jgi:hypothetical protein